MRQGTRAEPFAGVAELVDALDLGSSDESRGGSSPSARTSQGYDRVLPSGGLRDKKDVQTIMQVTETLSEGLKREFKVVVPASELDAKVNERLNDLKDRVQITGFRPGKVPVSHLKRLYGRSAMAEVIEATVRDTNTQIFTERGFKLASEPKVTLPTEQTEVEKLIAGQTRSRLHRRHRNPAADRAGRFQDAQAAPSSPRTSATPRSMKGSSASPTRIGPSPPRRRRQGGEGR